MFIKINSVQNSNKMYFPLSQFHEEIVGDIQFLSDQYVNYPRNNLSCGGRYNREKNRSKHPVPSFSI